MRKKGKILMKTFYFWKIHYTFKNIFVLNIREDSSRFPLPPLTVLISYEYIFTIFGFIHEIKLLTVIDKSI